NLTALIFYINATLVQDAVAPEPWKGVRDALQDGNNCPQFSGDAAVGDEDCLFVNVHAPRRPSWLADSFPVMVWVHGGGFVTGSGDASGLGPDYLICEDIIFVSLNYRLGVLGFLYLEAASPGNVGLKDQVFAERWVQANIAAFGGDPGSITLAGESAGSASVHLQMLSPMTHGLFQRAIAQSGAGLNPWAIQTTPVQTALNLAAALNCSAGDDYAAVVECLRGASTDALVLAAENVAPTQVDRDRMISFTFVPTPDYPVEGVETFLPAPVNELVTNNSHHAVPYLTGFNTRESILQLLFIAALVDATWKLTVLPDLRVSSNSSQVNEALQAMRSFFMNGESLSNDTFLQFMDMLTDIGAAHADDMGYLFRIAFLHDVPANSSAALGRKRMVKMWSNYVKTGDPTPTYDPLIGVRWRPYTNDTRNYLDITSQLEAKTDLNEERVNFWEQFYRTYANETT
ncbi:Acetylcholinesterase, partial [Gryllus bimaculatus]